MITNKYKITYGSDVDTQTQVTPSLSSAGLHDSNAFTLGEPVSGSNSGAISPLSGFNVGPRRNESLIFHIYCSEELLECTMSTTIQDKLI